MPPTTPPPPTLTDIVQAIKEALSLPEQIEFLRGTITWSLNESNSFLHNSLEKTMETQKHWLIGKFKAIPDPTDWDMDLLFELERRHTRQLLDQAVRELKTFIRERTPPPGYQA